MSKYIVIGDVHSSYYELMSLLSKVEEDRIPIFVGDFFDRGSHTKELASWLLQNKPIAVMGNHDLKLLRFLKGSNVKLTHGLNITVKALAELYNCNETELRTKANDLKTYLESLPNYILLQRIQDTIITKFVIVHGAIAPFFLDEKSETKSFDNFKDIILKYYAEKKSHIASVSLYGYTDGTKDSSGFPNRLPWADRWDSSEITVIHGHTPSTNGPVLLGNKKNVINVDTACCFGKQLTGILIPEMSFVSVESSQTWPFNKLVMKE